MNAKTFQELKLKSVFVLFLYGRMLVFSCHPGPLLRVFGVYRFISFFFAPPLSALNPSLTGSTFSPYNFVLVNKF